MIAPFAAFEQREFLGTPLRAISTGPFINELLRAAGDADRTRTAFVTYLNAWCSETAARDAEYAEILREADCVYADGQAVVWASRFLAAPLPERVNAGDFILDFCRAAAAAGVSIYLLGSDEGVAQKAAKAFEAAAPGLRVLGAESGFFADDDSGVVDRIRTAAPDVLLVGMSVPRQEKWARQNRDRLGVRVIWCVGALFEYYGGARARAPVWVRKAGLEWAFRLVLEPRRLWRRYILGNAGFTARVIAAKLARR